MLKPFSSRFELVELALEAVSKDLALGKWTGLPGGPHHLRLRL